MANGTVKWFNDQKGYGFIGCTSAGNDAFFVRNDKLNSIVKEIPLKQGYVLSKDRQSIDHKGNLTYISGSERKRVIKGMPVLNIVTDKIEEF